MGMSKVVVIGNLGRDPEMRYTPNGVQVTSFSVAANRKYRASDGSTREDVTWFNCSCWNRMAEVANEYLQKGSMVYIEGQLSMRTYQDNSGENRYSLDVMVRELQMLGSRDRDDGGYGNGQSRGPSRAPMSQEEVDDLPF